MAHHLPSELRTLILVYVPTYVLQEWLPNGVVGEEGVNFFSTTLFVAKLEALGASERHIKDLLSKPPSVMYPVYCVFVSIYGDLNYESNEMLPLSLCLNGAYQERNVTLLQHFLQAWHGKSGEPFVFEVTDLTWASGLEMIFFALGDKVVLPSILDVKLSPESENVIRQHVKTGVYSGYLTQTYTPINDFQQLIGHFRAIYDGRRPFVVHSTLPMIEIFRAAAIAEVNVPESFYIDHLEGWVQAGLETIRPDIVAWHMQLAAKTLGVVPLTVAFRFTRITWHAVERCNRMSQLIRQLPVSESRDFYLSQIEAYLDQPMLQTEDFAMGSIITTALGCANIKQLHAVLGDKLTHAKWIDAYYLPHLTSEILYHPAETIDFLFPLKPLIRKYITELWLQGFQPGLHSQNRLGLVLNQVELRRDSHTMFILQEMMK